MAKRMGFLEKLVMALPGPNPKSVRIQPVKYSPEWFRTISDEELYREREPIRIKARCSGTYNPHAETLLDAFDDESIRRMNIQYMKEHPNPKHYHSEHGWYLSETD